MKILLVNPCLRPSSPVKIIPVGLACIATALRDAGYKPDIFDIDLHRFTDKEVDNFFATHSYDIVGLGNIISSYKITKRLCTQVKQALPNTVLVVGNTVATSIPELLLTRVPQVDMAVIGEGDRTIVDIATTIAEGRPWHSVRGIAFRDGATVVKTPPREPISKLRTSHSRITPCSSSANTLKDRTQWCRSLSRYPPINLRLFHSTPPGVVPSVAHSACMPSSHTSIGSIRSRG